MSASFWRRCLPPPFWFGSACGWLLARSISGPIALASNNSETFSHYPEESIDLSREEAWSKLTHTDQAELALLADDEIATSHWFAHRAWVSIRANPLLVAWGAFRKLVAGFSPRLNPVREPLAQAAYAIAYAPVAVLGITGMFLAGQRSEVILIEMLFLAFMCVTAVDWTESARHEEIILEREPSADAAIDFHQ